MRIVAVITDADSAQSCLDAAALAARVDNFAIVDAIHVVSDPDTVVAASEELELQRLREPAEGTPAQRAEGARLAFVAWNAGVADDAPRIDWRLEEGSESDVVAREAEMSDLVVVARGHDMDSSDTLHACIYSARKPVLWVPGDWRSHARKFAHVAVALNAAPQAEQAVVAALPWLRAADKVTAITIDEGQTGLDFDLLGTFGLRAEPWIVARNSQKLGEQLAAQAVALGADLLVAGAFRHGEAVEWLLGHTTREMLGACSIPVMAAH